MALPHAILVSLREQIGSGYELAHRFGSSPVASFAPAGSIGYFWAATHQQIYRTLRTMAADGWVRVDEVVQSGRPDKKVYDVTDVGRAELVRWLAQPLTGRGSSVTDSRTRELAVKLRGVRFGDATSLAALREQVGALRRERATTLDAYLGFEERHFPDPSSLTGAALHQHLVLRGGIRAEQGSVEWLDEVLLALGGDS